MRLTGILLVCLVLSGLQGNSGLHDAQGAALSRSYFEYESSLFTTDCVHLRYTVMKLHPDNRKSVTAVKDALKKARLQYKKIEPVLSYFFPSTARVFNSPPTYEMEEPFLEYQQPIGFQLMESILFQQSRDMNIKELNLQAEMMVNSSGDLSSLMVDFHPSDGEMIAGLESALIRVMTLGISGYDAPDLNSGIRESENAMISIQTLMGFYISISDKNNSVIFELLKSGIKYLHDNPAFNSFDRLFFLTEFALPLQSAISSFCQSHGLEIPQAGLLNTGADHLFSEKIFSGNRGEQDYASKESTIRLGMRLFNDKALSKNSVNSCASCHQPARFFTDGQQLALAAGGHGNLLRNSPTLIYSGFQTVFFWDGRAKTLESQILDVLHNDREMGLDLEAFRNKSRDVYMQGALTDSLIAESIAGYLRSLHPMNADFDKYLHGNKTAMTPNQINGFNLFMGKAHCGTCHFMPLFDGLIPPDYSKNAFEVLGLPSNKPLKKQIPDDDPGKYNVYPLSFNRRSFKTPTLRNIAKTAPYMHNGCFKTLDEVLSFYNLGGGNGLGFENTGQTLSTDSLKLTKQEMKDIVSFMNALTDSL